MVQQLMVLGVNLLASIYIVCFSVWRWEGSSYVIDDYVLCLQIAALLSPLTAPSVIAAVQTAQLALYLVGYIFTSGLLFTGASTPLFCG